MSQRTASRSKRNSTARCHASSRDKGLPANVAAYSRRVFGVSAPRRVSTSPVSERYSLVGASSFSARPRARLRLPMAYVLAGRVWSRRMASSVRKREVGRGERVLPGVWRLRLPLPFPGVPHCNAWAVAFGAGIVLCDCGMHEPGSMAHLERALEQCNLRLEHVRLLVCTHAHVDHYGQAAAIVQRTGCELWMHPDHGHATRAAQDPEAVLQQRVEIARSAGVPPEPLAEWTEARRSGGT